MFWREHQERYSVIRPLREDHTAEAVVASEPVATSRAPREQRLRPLVAASLGCYGAALADGSEYRGDYGARVGQKRLAMWHKEKLDVLMGAEEADLVIFETIPCLEEVHAILDLVKSYHVPVRAVLCVSCADGEHLRSGEPLEEFAAAVWGKRSDNQDEARADVASARSSLVGVGINCTAPDHVSRAMEVLTQAAGWPTSSEQTDVATGYSNKLSGYVEPVLVVYPNSGEVWDAEGKEWIGGTGYMSDDGIKHFSRLAREWYHLGARVLGGCCRTSPAHIAAIRLALAADPGRSDDGYTTR